MQETMHLPTSRSASYLQHIDTTSNFEEKLKWCNFCADSIRVGLSFQFNEMIEKFLIGSLQGVARLGIF